MEVKCDNKIEVLNEIFINAGTEINILISKNMKVLKCNNAAINFFVLHVETEICINFDFNIILNKSTSTLIT